MRSDGLEKGMMLAHGDGRRRRGQPRRKWIDEIHEVTGMKLAELKDVTTERKQWRRLVKTVARAQSRHHKVRNIRYSSIIYTVLQCKIFSLTKQSMNIIIYEYW